MTDDPATRFRARMLRLSISTYSGSPVAPGRRKRCGTWDHYTGLERSFVPGVRRRGPGSGTARMQARERQRSFEPAESLGLERGPVVRSRTLDRQSERELEDLFRDIGIEEITPGTGA